LNANDLRAFLDARLAKGFHPNTARKWLVMARTLATWLYQEKAKSADTLLAIRDVRPPAARRVDRSQGRIPVASLVICKRCSSPAGRAWRPTRRTTPPRI
jgi:hypothetical protein